MNETLEKGNASQLLSKYLTNANYYLNSVDAKNTEIYRKNTLEFCLEHGLDEEFQRLVESNDKWRELAASKDVCFYVDVPEKDLWKKTATSPRDDIGIQLMTFEVGDPKPVIKVVSPHKLF